MSQKTLKSLILETREIDADTFVLVGTAFDAECGTAEWHMLIRNTDRRHKSVITKPLIQYMREWDAAMAECSDNDRLVICSAQDNGWDTAIEGGYAAAFGAESLETEAIACMFALLTMTLVD